MYEQHLKPVLAWWGSKPQTWSMVETCLMWINSLPYREGTRRVKRSALKNWIDTAWEYSPEEKVKGWTWACRRVPNPKGYKKHTYYVTKLEYLKMVTHPNTSIRQAFFMMLQWEMSQLRIGELVILLRCDDRIPPYLKDEADKIFGENRTYLMETSSGCIYATTYISDETRKVGKRRINKSISIDSLRTPAMIRGNK